MKLGIINGKGYELGIKFSKLFESSNYDFDYYKNVLENKDIKSNLEKVKEKLKRLYPDYLDEMYGRADGFNIDRDAYLLNICFEIYDSHESCTDVLIKNNNKNVLIGHNEDLSENLDEMILVKYEYNNEFFYDLSTYNCPQGTTFGWNNYGIVYSVNSIKINSCDEIGIPVWFILRSIVQCKNIDEVIKKIDITDCASAFSLNIVDSKNNRAFSIEKVLDKLDVIEIDEKYIHTNHIIHPNMDKNVNVEYESTLIRYREGLKQLNNLKNKEITIEDVKNILQFNKSKNEYIHRKIGEDEYPTVATFLFDSYSKKIEIYSYYDKQVIKFNMNET